jgi:hypothetical protein
VQINCFTPQTCGSFKASIAVSSFVYTYKAVWTPEKQQILLCPPEGYHWTQKIAVKCNTRYFTPLNSIRCVSGFRGFDSLLTTTKSSHEVINVEINTIEVLTPWSRVLPEKLKRPELLKKFPAFYGNPRFITAFTRARHLSLS